MSEKYASRERLGSGDRTYDEKFVDGSTDENLFQNKNVDWMSGVSPKLGYLVLVLFLWIGLYSSQKFDIAQCWTITNIAHGLITFYMFHWVKGCPDDSTQGEYNALTVYEQLDAGFPWTANKKFLILVPTLLTYFSCQAADYAKSYILINLSIFALCLIAKLPEMHRVRILGINSTPGIDSKVEYSPSRKKTN